MLKTFVQDQVLIVGSITYGIQHVRLADNRLLTIRTSSLDVLRACDVQLRRSVDAHAPSSRLH